MPENYNLELIKARVAPLESPHQDGLVILSGRVAPFLVERGWAGPSGSYWEQWSIRKGNREIVHQGEMRQIYVRGIQSITSYTDEVQTPITLEPGEYQLVFIVEGLFMGSVEIQATEKPSAAA